MWCFPFRLDMPFPVALSFWKLGMRGGLLTTRVGSFFSEYVRNMYVELLLTSPSLISSFLPDFRTICWSGELLSFKNFFGFSSFLTSLVFGNTTSSFLCSTNQV